MNVHRVSHLNRQDVRIDELTVHSYEMGLYLAEVQYDGRQAYLVGEDNKPQQFHSLDEVKQALGRSTIDKAYLVHQSAYDEMCGAADKGDNTLKVRIFVQQVN